MYREVNLAGHSFRPQKSEIAEATLPYGEFLCRPEDVVFTEAQQSIVDSWYDRHVEVQGHSPFPGGPKSREEYDMSVKRWLTGNYNPDTGMHTLYRYVDEPGVEAVNSCGGLTSRVIDNFGGGSDIVAVERLRRIVEGSINDEDRIFLEPLIRSRGRGQFGELSPKLITIDTACQLPQFQKHARDALEDIVDSLGSDKTEYFDRIREVLLTSAAPTEGSIYELFHSTIHLTTEPVEVVVAQGRRYRMCIQVRPGEFMPVGTFQGDDFVGHGPSGEWEWTGLGAYYPTGDEQIAVEERETTS